MIAPELIGIERLRRFENYLRNKFNIARAQIDHIKKVLGPLLLVQN